MAMSFTAPTIRGAVMLATVGFIVPSAAEAPLHIRNLSPAAQLYGVPRAMGADVLEAGYEMTFFTEFANSWSSDIDDDTLAFFDGEIEVLTYGYRRALADRWEFAVEVPYVIHHGGFLDRPIDEFHDVFGFDDDGRDLAGQGQLDYYVQHDGSVAIDMQRDTRDWGDVRAQIGYQLHSDADSSLAIRAMVKMPTGDSDQLTGSDGTDVATWIEYGRSSLFGNARASLNAGAGMVALGKGEFLSDAQEDFAGFAHFGLGFRLSSRLVALGQLNYHSRLIDTGLTQVAEYAVQGTLGARWHWNDGLYSEFAFVEDVKSDSTSDVQFQLVLGARLN